MMRRWRVWIALWAGWTGLALFIAAGASLTYVVDGTRRELAPHHRDAARRVVGVGCC